MDTRIRIGDHEYLWEWLRGEGDAPQQILAAAHAQQETSRPRCECRPNGPAFYVAIRNDRYHLARMPGTAADHHPRCPFYIEPARYSGRSAYAQNAISEDLEGLAHLRVAFPLAPDDEPQPGGISLQAVLHEIVDRAGLNRWFPAMAGKRHWGVVRHAMLTAADTLRVRRRNLAHHLYSPPPYRPNLSEARDTERRQFREGLNGRYGIVLGELRSYESSRFGYQIKLRQENTPYYLSTAVHDAVNRNHGWVTAKITAGDTTGHVLVLGLVETSTSGNLLVREAALLRLTEDWLPSAGPQQERQLADLVSRQVAFKQPLWFDAAKTGWDPIEFHQS